MRMCFLFLYLLSSLKSDHVVPLLVGRSSDFQQQFDSILDINTSTNYANKVAERWLACRLEGVASLVVGLSAIFATHVVISNGVSIGNSNNFASLAGVSLSYAVTATGMMQFVVRAFATVESAMNSVERITYYTESIPQEAAHTADELEKEKLLPANNSSRRAIAAAGGKIIQPDAGWPEKGAITLTNLKMKYRQDTPLVLKGVNVTINAGERVGELLLIIFSLFLYHVSSIILLPQASSVVQVC